MLGMNGGVSFLAASSLKFIPEQNGCSLISLIPSQNPNQSLGFLTRSFLSKSFAVSDKVFGI